MSVIGWPLFNPYNKIRQLVCLSVCVYPSSAQFWSNPHETWHGHSWDWHGVGKVVLCHSGFVLRAKRVMGQKGNHFFSFLCISEHFESIETQFFRKFSWAQNAKHVLANRARCEREAWECECKPQSTRERSDWECESKAQSLRKQSDRVALQG